MQGTAIEMTEIRAIETEAALPHQLGCFETYAEVAVEIEMAETGDFDEILDDGRPLIAHFHSDVEPGSHDCQCQD